MVFLTLFAAIITADKTKKAPILAAIANAQFEKPANRKAPPKTLEPRISKATPKLAPEEIPSTKGPASGLRNKVCINNPQIDKPEPTIIAVIAFGKRKFTIMVCQLSFEAIPPVKLLKISLKGIETEPKLIFKNKKTISSTESIRKCLVYLFEEFN